MKDLIEGCSKRVWEQLGPGYNEVVYQKALNYELNCNGILTDTERYIMQFILILKGINTLLQQVELTY